jgi:hypothetical protein
VAVTWAGLCGALGATRLGFCLRNSPLAACVVLVAHGRLAMCAPVALALPTPLHVQSQSGCQCCCSKKSNDASASQPALAETDERHPEHPRNLIPELCRNFYDLGWVTGTGGGIAIKQGSEDMNTTAVGGLWPPPLLPVAGGTAHRSPRHLMLRLCRQQRQA